LTQHLRFDGAAKGAVETVDVEITTVVIAGGQPLLIQPVLIGATDRLWLTIGAAPPEGYSIAREAWRFEEIEPHWDRLILRSSTGDVPLADLGLPRDLIARSTGSKRLGVGVALFCGAGAATEASLVDPVLQRTLTHGYRVQSPPLVS